MFCHEIRKLFLAGSCSERGRLGNTIFQRAAGHALESIDLAQIRFVFNVVSIFVFLASTQLAKMRYVLLCFLGRAHGQIWTNSR